MPVPVIPPAIFKGCAPGKIATYFNMAFRDRISAIHYIEIQYDNWTIYLSISGQNKRELFGEARKAIRETTYTVDFRIAQNAGTGWST